MRNLIQNYKAKRMAKVEEDSFADFCNERAIVKAMDYHAIIKDARLKANKNLSYSQIESARKFIGSCEAHLIKTGFLSDKQIEVLKTIHVPKSYFEHDDDWGDDDSHDWYNDRFCESDLF